MRRVRRQDGASWAGLLTGSVAWGINTQLGYSLVPWVCASKLYLHPAMAIVLAVIALSGGLISWRSFARQRALAETQGGGHPYNLLAAVSASAAVLFAAVILTQGAAGLLMHGCER